MWLVLRSGRWRWKLRWLHDLAGCSAERTPHQTTAAERSTLRGGRANVVFHVDLSADTGSPPARIDRSAHTYIPGLAGTPVRCSKMPSKVRLLIFGFVTRVAAVLRVCLGVLRDVTVLGHHCNAEGGETLCP